MNILHSRARKQRNRQSLAFAVIDVRQLPKMLTLDVKPVDFPNWPRTIKLKRVRGKVMMVKG